MYSYVLYLSEAEYVKELKDTYLYIPLTCILDGAPVCHYVYRLWFPDSKIGTKTRLANIDLFYCIWAHRKFVGRSVVRSVGVLCFIVWRVVCYTCCVVVFAVEPRSGFALAHNYASGWRGFWRRQLKTHRPHIENIKSEIQKKKQIYETDNSAPRFRKASEWRVSVCLLVYWCVCVCEVI